MPTSSQRPDSPHRRSAHRRSSIDRRIPRAGIDPIASIDDAMAVFTLQMARPLRSEVLVLFLDTSGCGITAVTISGTADPACVIDIAETMAMSALDQDHVGGLILASVRPGGTITAADDERWCACCDAVESAGLILYDWLIVGRAGAVSVRHELGLAPPWPT